MEMENKSKLGRMVTPPPRSGGAAADDPPGIDVPSKSFRSSLPVSIACSDDDSALPPKRGKGKAPMAELSPRRVDPPRPWSDFMAAARDAYRRPAVRSEAVPARAASSRPDDGWLAACLPQAEE
jgi:hypothetical protein